MSVEYNLIGSEPAEEMIAISRANKGTVDALLCEDDGEVVHDFVRAWRAMWDAAPQVAGLPDSARDKLLCDLAASFVHTFNPDDRLDQEYVAQCILSHRSNANQ